MNEEPTVEFKVNLDLENVKFDTVLPKNENLLSAMKAMMTSSSTGTTTTGTTVSQPSNLTAGSNQWSNSIYTSTAAYMPPQTWIPQCAHCLSQDKYSPAVTLIAGDAVCIDCAKQALNIIVED